MKIYYSDTFELPLPENHRFPMAKYRLLRERIQASTEFKRCELLLPPEASDEQLALVHLPEYVNRVTHGRLTDLEIKRIGFPWSPKMVIRSRRSVGASIAACQSALHDGAGVNLAGGTHHAFPDAGQGFCVFNDTVVAARVAQRAGWIQRAMFVDCDVHQGNGTSAVAKQDPTLFSFSIHCETNYPFRKTAGDSDIALPKGTDDATYLRHLDHGFNQALDRFQPDVIFYLAGADPYHGDRLGQFNLTKQGLQARDQFVFDTCRQHGLPVAISMAGGYAPNIADIVDIHFQTVDLARRCFVKPAPSPTP